MRLSYAALGVKWDSATKDVTNQYGDILFHEDNHWEADDTMRRWSETFHDACSARNLSNFEGRIYVGQCYGILLQKES